MRVTILTASICLCLAATSAKAQALYGSFVGNVTDASGLAVPGATVSITNTETNQSRNGVTNEMGAYLFPNIATGTYDVVVTLPGFQTFTVKNIIVRQNTAVRVDAALKVGTLEESVQVSATAVLLQTETAAVQTQTTREQLENLPTSGRSFQSLLALTPGVQQPNYFQHGGINNPSRAMTINVNGQPTTNTVVRIDGVSATNQWIEALQAYSPSMEAIESVSITTSSFDADQGMAGGASVNVQIKSGTNTLRGSLFEYLTSAKLRTRSYYLPSDQEKPDDTRNVFGGTVGGPILRDKLFYFVSVESTIQRTIGGPYSGTSAQLLSLPPVAIRRGDFSATSTVIYDPLTGNAAGQNRIPFAFANCPGLASTTDPRFASCNYIPARRINPLAARVAALQPAPVYDGATRNFFSTPRYDVSYHKIDSKVTWNAGNKLNLNTRISYLPVKEISGGLYDTSRDSDNILDAGIFAVSNVASTSIAGTSILSPTFVVDSVFGFTRQHTQQRPRGDNTCAGDTLAIANSCFGRDTALPGFTTGFQVYGGSSALVFDYLDPQYQFAANAGWTKSGHNLKFGVDLHRLHVNHYQKSGTGFTFNGGATALNGGASTNLYNQYADFLLGLPQSAQNSRPTPLLNEDNGSNLRPQTLRSWEFGLYVRDQWQLTRKLTASAGLRWEYYPVPRRADRGVELFDLTTNTLLLCGVGDNRPTCGVQVQKDLFTPRIGLAYRINDSVVARAGVSRNPQNDNMYRFGIDGYPSTIAITVTGPNTFTPYGSITDGLPLVPQAVGIDTGRLTLPPGASVITLPLDYVRGQITSFNVSVQKVFMRGFTAQIGYVGNRQLNMVRNENLNYGTIGGGAASQPFNQPGLPNGLRTTSRIQRRVGTGKIVYDSLQASLSRRMSNGFSFTSAYTLSKSLDWWAGCFHTNPVRECGIEIPEYYYLNKGVAGANGQGGTASTPQKFDLSATLELPFGTGKRFLSDSPILGKIAGGWTLNTVFTGFSGQPFSITSNATSLNAPGSTQRADQVKATVKILGGHSRGEPYFDVLAFRPVTDARFGNVAPNSMRGPGVANLDASLFRTFKLRTTMNVQLRFEAFNVTNTPHFGVPGGVAVCQFCNVSNLQLNPDGSILSLNGFGEVTMTNSTGREYDERYFRLGVRMTF